MHDHSFKLSQSAYIDQLRETPLSAERRKHRGEATSDREKSLLRSALGGLNCAAQQTNMIHASGVSLLLSSVNTSTVQTLIETNKLITRPKHRNKSSLSFMLSAKMKPWRPIVGSTRLTRTDRMEAAHRVA